MLNFTIASTAALNDLESLLRDIRVFLFEGQYNWFWFGVMVAIAFGIIHWVLKEPTCDCHDDYDFHNWRDK